jgi:hypothetical protein
MTALTTDRISTELLQDTLLPLEQVTTSVTVLALNATAHPEQSPRVRVLLERLVALVQECEGDLGTYAPLNA